MTRPSRPRSAGQQPRRLSPLAAVLRADNPGPMTLDGTNSYLIGAGPGTVVVDPGPDDPAHLDGLLAAAAERADGVELILLTHAHDDHSGGAARLQAKTGAPVRAADPGYCLGGGKPLEPGERIVAAGTSLEVLSTPGHTADSVCFRLADGSVLTGDTVLGRGSTVIAAPDGSLRDYLESLARLADCGPVTMLPGHGPVRSDLAEAVAGYRGHRAERLTQIRSALVSLGRLMAGPTGPDWVGGPPDAIRAPLVVAVTDAVYAQVDPALRTAAEQSVWAQLEYLRTELRTDGG